MTTISTPPEEHQSGILPQPEEKSPNRFTKRLPQIVSLVQQQGALIALIIVVTFSLIRYDNFDNLTIISVLNFKRSSA